MDDFKEQQDEEREVLESIYEGDTSFNQVSNSCFQYKFGEEDTKSFVVEITWLEEYPSVIPSINLDVFHNSYLPEEFRNEIKSKLTEQANDLLETAMTYSLFDWMKENSDEYLNRIPEMLEAKKTSRSEKISEINGDINNVKVRKEKKEQLTKAQKRRITQQTNFKGERERGWNWVDVVRHLSQTGGGAS